ncbi:hypothetical protein BDQ17DRAFT_1244802 [Cyathus striatus]|nr:hypothetical protein BDQ17DRAFT_1244802 [Cyathus striatus]
MTVISPSIDTYLSLSLIISTTWIYYSFIRPSTQKPRSQKAISAFLLLHTLYIIYHILVTPPPNLFKLLKVPVNTPTDTIRALLLKYSDDGAIPSHLERVVKRLSSFDLRTLYIRFGHNVLATCEYCLTYEDFAVYALPRPLLSYVRELAVVGIVSLDMNNRAHLRGFGVGTLIVAALAEIYYLATSPINIPPRGVEQDVFMWHDTLLKARHMLFLVLPLLIQHLPTLLPPTLPIRIPILSGLVQPPPGLTPSARLQLNQTTLQTLDHLLPALHLLKYTRAALMRTPETRERSEKWWKREAREGAWIRSDEGVKRAARAAGVGFDTAEEGGGEEGKLRTSARIAVDTLKKGGLASGGGGA